MKYLSLIMIAFFSSCTLSDKAEYTIITKAAFNVHYKYTKDGVSNVYKDIDHVSMFIFNGKNHFFRRSDISNAQLRSDSGFVQTYLPNDTYTVVSVANIGDNTQVPNFTESTTLSNALLSIKNNKGVATTADNLLYHLCSFKIVKGDQKRIDVDLSKITYIINLNVLGINNIENSHEYVFKLFHSAGFSLDGSPSKEKHEYSPQLEYGQTSLGGQFNVLQFGKSDNIKIGLYKAYDMSPLFESEIGAFLSDAIREDLLSGKTVSIDLNIDINKTEIKIYISDWLISTIQRTDIGS